MLGLSEFSVVIMAGQANALALARIMLEQRRLEAEKLRRSKGVLEEQVRILLENIHVEASA